MPALKLRNMFGKCDCSCDPGTGCCCCDTVQITFGDLEFYDLTDTLVYSAPISEVAESYNSASAPDCTYNDGYVDGELSAIEVPIDFTVPEHSDHYTLFEISIRYLICVDSVWTYSAESHWAGFYIFPYLVETVSQTCDPELSVSFDVYISHFAGYWKYRVTYTCYDVSLTTEEGDQIVTENGDNLMGG